MVDLKERSQEKVYQQLKKDYENKNKRNMVSEELKCNVKIILHSGGALSSFGFSWVGGYTCCERSGDLWVVLSTLSGFAFGNLYPMTTGLNDWTKIAIKYKYHISSL